MRYFLLEDKPQLGTETQGFIVKKVKVSEVKHVGSGCILFRKIKPKLGAGNGIQNPPFYNNSLQ